MGGFYNSIHIRTLDRAAVKATVKLIARSMNIRCLLGPEINGWVGVYPDVHGQKPNISRDIAQQIDADVLHLMVHDDDLLAYWLYRNRKLVDSYWSKPGYFGDENRVEEEKHCGHAEQFQSFVGDSVDKLATLLDRAADWMFESERLTALAKVLGISNTVTAYEYLTSDEREGIRGWRSFEHIPPNPATPKTVDRKAKRNARKLIRQKLTKSGNLLFHQEWNDFPQLANGFSLGPGFILGCVNPWQKSAALSELMPPLYVPQPWQSDHNVVAGHTSGGLTVVDSGALLRVVDMSSSPWKPLLELPRNASMDFAAISPDGMYIARGNQLKLDVTRIADGQRVCEIARVRSGRVAFHPHERWMAVTGDQLALIRFDGEPSVREMMVGGKHRLVEQLPPEIEGQLRRRYRHNADALSILTLEKSNEIPRCVGFSTDGRLMWCGTDRGLRVYNWAALSRESGGTTQAEVWRFSYPDLPETDLRQQVNVIAEEVDGAGIAFGGDAARIMRLDLATGKAQMLIELPGGGSVESLLFSRDGTALAAHACVTRGKGLRSMPEYTRSWEVWSYRKLTERCETSEVK
ncbi:MAG TPA: hypothetical protein VGI81_23845 [Tepidisphaeraceae bacterium]|jgi:hypothetical protein